MFDGHKPGTLPHAGTFNNNVWSMAAGRVAMGEIFDAAAADALFARGEALRDALNAACARAGVAMQFTGLGSMLNVHFRHGPITGPYAATEAENKLRELFFFDLLGSGIYLARRGMAALSLPVTGGGLRPLCRRRRGVHRHPQAPAGRRRPPGVTCRPAEEIVTAMPMPPAAAVRRSPPRGAASCC